MSHELSFTSNINYKKFSSIDLSDSFFDSLRADYQGFQDWFQKKSQSEEGAYVYYDKNKIQAFLYLKKEEGTITDIAPPLNTNGCLKVGTLKVNPHGTLLGERFIKIICDTVLRNNLRHAYVTIFPKHKALLTLLKKYGFQEYGSKGEELVLVKDFTKIINDLEKDFPLIQARGVRKYLLGIYPKFHTQLFPDSKLNTESEKIIQDMSETNSIHKTYIARMRGLEELNPHDIVLIYRTAEGGKRAEYSSVVTSVCVVESIKSLESFQNKEYFVKSVHKSSVFSEAFLQDYYQKQNGKNTSQVIRFTYNIALKKRIVRADLIDKIGIKRDAYAGFISLSDEQFSQIINLGNIDEGFIIN